MSGLGQFSLRWNNFHSNLSTGFHDLLREEQLVDVTLATEGKLIKAHQVVLSVCSPYFRKIFQINPCQHPVVILNISYRDLRDILTFIYQGEVNVRQEDLTGFLKAAELLQIKGLTGEDNERSSEDSDNASTKNSVHQESESIDNVYQNTFDYQPSDDVQKSLKRSSSFMSKSPNNSISSNVFRKKKRAFQPNRTTSSNVLSFSSDNSVDSTSEQKYSTANINNNNITADHLIPSNNIPDSNNDETNFVNQLTSEHLEEINEIENTNIKNEVDLDETNISNNSQYFDGNSSVVDKDNGGFYSLDGRSTVYFQCSMCSKKFVNRYNLKIHMRDKHNPNGQNSLTCELCGKTMRNQSCLRVHKYNHRKNAQS